MKLRRIRALSRSERLALHLLRPVEDGSSALGDGGAKALSLDPAAIRRARRTIEQAGLILLNRGAAFLREDEMIVLAIMAAFQRSAAFSAPADDPVAASLRSIAEALLDDGHLLSWRSSYQQALLARGWSVGSDRGDPSRRRVPSLAKQRIRSTGTIQGMLVTLLRHNGRMTSAQIVSAGISRQYLSILTASGITSRLGFNCYALGPNAPGE
jgi:hypothetical protein